MAKRAEAQAESSTAEQPEPPRVVPKPPPDANAPIELSALFLDRPYGLNQVSNVIRVGAGVQNGIGVGGLCEAITLYPNGTTLVTVRKGVTNPKAPEREKMPLQYLTFREGFGEVAT